MTGALTAVRPQGLSVMETGVPLRVVAEGTTSVAQDLTPPGLTAR